MGYMTELNTLLRPPQSFDFSSITPGLRATVTIARERTFPLHIAVLLVDHDWNFYGYAVVHQAVITNDTTKLTFEMLTVFSEQDKKRYRTLFMEAAKKTGEI